MSAVLLTKVQVFDGTGTAPFAAEDITERFFGVTPYDDPRGHTAYVAPRILPFLQLHLAGGPR